MCELIDGPLLLFAVKRKKNSPHQIHQVASMQLIIVAGADAATEQRLPAYVLPGILSRAQHIQQGLLSNMKQHSKALQRSFCHRMHAAYVRSSRFAGGIKTVI